MISYFAFSASAILSDSIFDSVTATSTCALSRAICLASSSFAMSRSCTVVVCPLVAAELRSISWLRFYISSPRFSIFCLLFSSLSFDNSRILYILSSSLFKWVIVVLSCWVIFKAPCKLAVCPLISPVYSRHLANNLFSFSWETLRARWNFSNSYRNLSRLWSAASSFSTS